MINIKEKIGQRITHARKIKGLTRKALAELTDDIKQSRINNWERGIRTPGPREIKQLSEALEVDAAYLMCLSDEANIPIISDSPVKIPLLDAAQIPDFQCLPDDYPYIPVNPLLSSHLGISPFAFRISDISMEPELKQDDILLINQEAKPNPGDFVLAHIQNEKILVVRKFRQISLSGEEFLLLPLNENWASINAGKDSEIFILGIVKGVLRIF